MRPRIAARGVILAVGLALLAGPGAGAAGAATTVGQLFLPNATNCMPKTFIQTGVQGGNPYRVPSAGVITSWSFEHNNAIVPGLKLKVARPANVLLGDPSTQVGLMIVGESLAGAQTPDAVNTYPTRISVQAGDLLGIYAGGGGCGLTPSEGGDTYATNSSDEPLNGTDVYTKNVNGRFPVAASVEPDADQDGFGDQTQDGCPANHDIQGPCPVAPDTIAPSIPSLALGSKTFRAAAKGGSVARKARPVGTKVSYKLSEAASAKFTVERALKGRKKGKKCVAPNSHNRHAKRCARYRRLKGSFTRASTAGANSFRFTGRLRGKKLSPGRYRLVMVATDAAGNKSKPKRAFRIVRR